MGVRQAPNTEETNTDSLVYNQGNRTSGNGFMQTLGEHSAIVGKTGSGKTVFMSTGLLSYIANMFPHAKRYVIDSTDDPDMETLVPFPLVVNGDKAPDRLADSRYTLIWKPRHAENPTEYAKFFRMLGDDKATREPAIVVIDEITSITGEALYELEPLLKQLRKHGGTVVILTQSIAGIPSNVFKQCTHFFQFLVNNSDYELRQCRQYLEIEKDDYHQPDADYGFWYRKQSRNAVAQQFPSVRAFFGRFMR